MSKYYCLIAGLPDLQIDDQKLAFTTATFKEECYPQLSKADQKIFDLFFFQYDNSNLLQFLKSRDAEIDPRGTLSSDDMELLVREVKEDGESPNTPLPYLNQFIPSYLSEQPLYEGMLWEDQLATLYYAHGLSCKNSFVASWFELNLNINNLLVAFTARKHQLNVADYIVGENSVATALRSNTTRDFGLTGTLPYFESVARIAEEDNLFERERKIDQLKWDWLEENTFFHYFTFERVYAYLLKLAMIERWHSLNREAGEQRFREALQTLKKEVVLPSEFTENL